MPSLPAILQAFRVCGSADTTRAMIERFLRAGAVASSPSSSSATASVIVEVQGSGLKVTTTSGCLLLPKSARASRTE
jgi:hypothetical protein